jgi:hypothetical protein
MRGKDLFSFLLEQDGHPSLEVTKHGIVEIIPVKVQASLTSLPSCNLSGIPH